jgi:hypothetical protein
LEGIVHRYDDIDFDQEWFNVISGTAADPEDMKAVQLPPHLKPHFRSFRFRFYPEEHKMVFVHYLPASLTNDKKAPGTFAHSKAQAFWNALLNDNELDHPPVEVTVVQDSHSLDQIFKWSRIQRLWFEIIRPNPGTRQAAMITKRMDEMRASRLVEEISARRGDAAGIAITDEIKGLMDMSLENGGAVAEGTDIHEKKVSVITEEHPLVEIATKAKAQNFNDAFAVAAETLMEKRAG